MPRHDHRRLRVRRRAWFGLILVLLPIAAGAPIASPSAVAQDGAGTSSAPPSPSVREPIDLAGHTVRTWRVGDEQWVLLNGLDDQPAAVMRGVEGVRAREIVVRLTTTPGDAGPSYRLDVYAEGLAILPGQPARPSRRFTLRSDDPPKLSPYDRRNFSALAGPPAGSGALARCDFAKPAPAAVRQAIARAQAAPRPDRQAAAPPGVLDLPADALVTRIEPAPSPAPARRDPAVQAAQYVRPAPAPPATAPPLPSAGLPDVVESPAGDRPAEADGEGGLPTVVEAQRRRVEPEPEGLPGVVEAPGSGRDDVPLPPPAESTPELESAPTVPVIPDAPERGRPETELNPLPDAAPPSQPRRRPRDPEKAKNPFTPIFPGSQRITIIAPRNSSPNFLPQRLPTANGMDIMIIRGGVNIITRSKQLGEVDISADQAVIWRRVNEDGSTYALGPNGEQIEDANAPMEVYLEGNVVFRQDEKKVAGNGDQRVYRAERVYYDALSDRAVVLNAELDMFSPGLVAPARVKSPRMEQFRPLERNPDGTYKFGLQQIRAERTTMTGSRFPNPGYRITSRAIDITRIRTRLANPNNGKPVDRDGKDEGDGAKDPDPPEDLSWLIDARQNLFMVGPVPGFYWPRVRLDTEDLEPPLRQFTFRTNNYFGQQALADFNGFRLIGQRRPKFIDLWNVDLDYLSYRTKRFPALGTEIGWFGNDLLGDLRDPYGKDRERDQDATITNDYFGYFDIWGLYDSGRDNLGTGPAIITTPQSAGKIGYDRGTGGPSKLNGVPPEANPRGRLNFRHMQRLIPDDLEHVYEDSRLQLEVGGTTDRYFLEEYYKRLFDVGMDQETLAYYIRQKENTAWSLWTEANMLNWQTESQWLPKLDYYRLGDSPLGNWITYYQHTGVDYDVLHTASEVNNPYIFAYLPYDPISNTSGTWKSGRGYTAHEVDLKVDLGGLQQYVRLVPFVQGQLVGWSEQINGQAVGRAWGAYGLRAEAMAYRAFPAAQSELFNVHGLNHKISLGAEYRYAVSSVNLNQLGVQDDLDDNTYEETRRYFALTNYAGGILPPQYDPRFLILRRTLSPITGTTDIQGNMETLHVGLHQRLQTKRGPEGRRKIIDYMVLDLDTTYFPNAARDNFNKPFGQNMYNWQWFVGDRTSIISYGWFEFFNITGLPIYSTNTNRNQNPFGVNVITSGISISRPPRGSLFLGYTILNSGPIATSAPVTSLSYWLSPKWYGSASLTYDFGDHILLASSGTLTRIGADYLTSIGLTVDPQRQSYMFAFQVTPRISPNMRMGSSTMAAFDARYAPTQ